MTLSAGVDGVRPGFASHACWVRWAIPPHQRPTGASSQKSEDATLGRGPDNVCDVSVFARGSASSAHDDVSAQSAHVHEGAPYPRSLGAPSQKSEGTALGRVPDDACAENDAPTSGASLCPGPLGASSQKSEDVALCVPPRRSRASLGPDQSHLLYTTASFVFCGTCGSYSLLREIRAGSRLLQPCDGPPSNAYARRVRDGLMQGVEPTRPNLIVTGHAAQPYACE